MKNMKKMTGIVLAFILIAALGVVPVLAVGETVGVPATSEHVAYEGTEDYAAVESVAFNSANGTVMEYATGCEIILRNPVVDQTVKDVNREIAVKTKGFSIEEIYWVENGFYPVLLPDGTRVGTISMGEKGLVLNDGTEVPVMGENDKFASGNKYLLVLSITSTKGIMSSESLISVNGMDMVYEGFADKEKTGKSLLYGVMLGVSDKDAPNGTFMANGVDSGILTNVDTTMKYSTDGGASWTPCSATEVTVTGLSACVLQVAYIDNPVNVQKISITKAEVPTGIGSTNCTTTDNNDGTITGLNSSMEYRASSSEGYTKVSEKVIKGLKPDTYYVRAKAAGTVLASGDVTVQIAAHKASVPSIVTQPKDVTVVTGKDAVISVKAEGEGLKYEWHYVDHKDGKDSIIDPKDTTYFVGQTTETLNIKSVNKFASKEFDCEYSGDKYYCVISNESGKIQTNVVTYTVNHSPSKEWKKDSSSHWNVCVCGKIVNKSTHTDSNNDGKCDACGFDMSSFLKLKITAGADSLWIVGYTEPIVIACDAKVEGFKSLKMDGKTVDKNNYTVKTENGGTVIELKPEYLDKLSNNTHEVTLVFADGSVSTELTVYSYDHKDDQKKTPSLLAMILIIVCVLIAAAVVVLIILLVKNKKYIDPEKKKEMKNKSRK